MLGMRRPVRSGLQLTDECGLPTMPGCWPAWQGVVSDDLLSDSFPAPTPRTKASHMKTSWTRRRFLVAAAGAGAGARLFARRPAVPRPAILGGPPGRKDPFPAWPVAD